MHSVEGVCSVVRARTLHVLERHATRLNMVVVLAGEPDGVERFLASGSNGRWVFPRQWKLKDYDDEQLRRILLQLIEHNSFTVEGGDDGPYPRIVAKRVGRARGSPGFANAYDLVLEFNNVMRRQAARLKKEKEKAQSAVAAAADAESGTHGTVKGEGGPVAESPDEDGGGDKARESADGVNSGVKEAEDKMPDGNQEPGETTDRNDSRPGKDAAQQEVPEQDFCSQKRT